jgi:histidinol dehydrogenase
MLRWQVIADNTCNPAHVAADLLSQAEHGVDSQVVLVAVDLPVSVLSEVESQVDAQARALERVEIIRQSVEKSIIVQVDDIDAALAFSNDYAPEHLILHIEKAAAAVAHVQNAGSVFVGPFSPERQVVICSSVPCVTLMVMAGVLLTWCALRLAAETTPQVPTTRCQRMATLANSVA